jgi:hypothetical protein
LKIKFLKNAHSMLDVDIADAGREFCPSDFLGLPAPLLFFDGLPRLLGVSSTNNIRKIGFQKHNFTIHIF